MEEFSRDSLMRRGAMRNSRSGLLAWYSPSALSNGSPPWLHRRSGQVVISQRHCCLILTRSKPQDAHTLARPLSSKYRSSTGP